MQESRDKVLTAGVLAKFVLGKEGHQFRVLTLLKERELTPIYYSIGLLNLKEFASILKMPHSQIGFAGRVQGFVERQAKLRCGGVGVCRKIMSLALRSKQRRLS